MADENVNPIFGQLDLWLSVTSDPNFQEDIEIVLPSDFDTWRKHLELLRRNEAGPDDCFQISVGNESSTPFISISTTKCEEELVLLFNNTLALQQLAAILSTMSLTRS